MKKGSYRGMNGMEFGAPKPIPLDQIGRSWKHYAKKPLGITADFYSLKHLNTDATVDALGMEDSAAQNGIPVLLWLRMFMQLMKKKDSIIG